MSKETLSSLLATEQDLMHKIADKPSAKNESQLQEVQEKIQEEIDKKTSDK